jgi:hypothetical protein
VNSTHLAVLVARLKHPSTKPSMLYAKAQGLREISDAGVLEELDPEARERLRVSIEKLLIQCESSGTWHGDRAAGLVGGVLDRMSAYEQRLEDEANRGLWPAGDPWFPLDFPGELRVALGYPRTWDVPAEVTDADAELLAEAERAINASPDPIATANAWLKEHRRVIPGGELAPDEIEPSPDDAGYVPD